MPAVEIGVFVTPLASDPVATVEQIVLADRVGLDVVGVQDHPYQRRFLDTWTLLAFAAARTERIRLLPDVANLPLRPPAMLAKAAASLDALASGRLILGLGAGAFWDGVEAMGGPRRSPRESVDALEEALGILRAFFSGEHGVRVDGRHYRLAGAQPGPVPERPPPIWLGAYGPRMLRITGRLADGWLPSLGYLALEDAAARHAAIDEAARAAGREPSEIRRGLNVIGEGGGPPSADELVRLAADHRFETLVAGPGEQPLDGIRRLGEEIAPRVRETLGR